VPKYNQRLKMANDPEDAPAIRVAEVLSALSFALDLTEGQPAGHAIRSCIIGMYIAREAGLPIAARSDLYYALLMKDAGCSANASKMMQILGTDDIAGKRGALAVDWTRLGWESVRYALAHVKTGAPFLERMRALYQVAVNRKRDAKIVHRMRCERGADIARRLGLSEAAAEAIQCLNEHWDGLGQPLGLRREEIPTLSRIMCVAQTADVFYSHGGGADRAAAVEMVRKRSGRWFDPEVARAFVSAARGEALWLDVENAAVRVHELEPRHELIQADEAFLDNVCLAFAEVIDAKSPFTYRHSTGVAAAAVAIARSLDLGEAETETIRRAALLHDIGKLSVPNTILDKPDKLTQEEWATIRKHPYYSLEVLRRIPGFGEIAEIAASHHEKLDGSGYFRNLTGERLSLPARILVVADIYDALAAERPYRDALPLETVLGIMSKDVPRALDARCFEALKESAGGRLTSPEVTSASAGLSSSGPPPEAEPAPPASRRKRPSAEESEAR